MKTRFIFCLTSIAILIALSLAGCSTTPESLTVSYNGKKCVYDGPTSLNVGQNTLKVKAAKDITYGVVIIKFLEGKTKADLEATSSLNVPPS